MAEYTYENIIINPIQKDIESLIRKEVYFHNNPSLCLENANEKSTSNLGILVEISKNSIVPFRIEQKCGTCAHTCAHACIIVKKEEPKPKYVPFESKEEFIDAFHYHDNANYSETEDILLNYGMWLRCKANGGLFQVVGFLNDAVYLNLRAFDTNYQGMLNDFEFLDGSPCGKESKDV